MLNRDLGKSISKRYTFL